MREVNKEERWEGELIHTTKNGHRITLLSRWALQRDDAGTPSAVMEINLDITKGKQAERALQSAYVYNRSLIEAGPDPLVTITTEGKIGDVNAATESITGRARGELIGTDFSDYFTDPEEARAGYRRVFDKGYVRDYPLEIKRKDGHVTQVLYNASVYRDDAGNVLGVFAGIRDITDQMQMEEQLRRPTSWRPSAPWRGASPTTSTTCWPSSSGTQNWRSTGSSMKRRAATSRRYSAHRSGPAI